MAFSSILRGSSSAGLESRSRRAISASRRGVAATETALTLPLLVLIVFGSIEIANGVFLKQSLTIAAYEGARTLSKTGVTSAQGEARVDEVLTERSIADYDVSITPTVTANTPRGTELTVTVSAPASYYRVGPIQFLEGRTISRQFRMVRL